MTAQRAALASALLWVAPGLGCGGGPSSAEGLGERFTCVAAAEPTYLPYDQEGNPYCAAPRTIAPGQSGRLLDLGSMKAGGPGTCGPFLAERSLIEIDATLGFPIWIRLPALGGGDPACETECLSLGAESPSTAFGIAFVFADDFYPFTTGHAFAMRIPAPWYFLAADEHDATPCISGYPSVLEYGQPLACVTTGGNHFGLATSDPFAPSVDVLVDLVPREQLDGPCCVYGCEGR